MADTLEILDLPESGQIQLSIIDESGRRESAPPVSFPFPLTDEELLELAWLFTAYAAEPFGESRARAETAEAGTAQPGAADAGIGLPLRAAEAAEILARVGSAGKRPLPACPSYRPRPEIVSLPWELS